MAFLIQLGVCNDPKNKINKVLRNPVNYQCNVKKHVSVVPTGGVVPMEGINIVSPQLILKGDTSLLSKNYAYIPDFRRFYFVSNVEVAPSNIYTLSLTEDVLMSFRDEILKCEAMLSRSADFRNYYLHDDRLPITQQTLTWNHAFSDTPFREKNFDAIVTFLGPTTPA